MPRLLCRELTLQYEYLRAENKILKSKIKGRIRFTDDDHRSLVDAALAMGRKLMQEVVSIVKPETYPDLAASLGEAEVRLFKSENA